MPEVAKEVLPDLNLLTLEEIVDKYGEIKNEEKAIKKKVDYFNEGLKAKMQARRMEKWDEDKKINPEAPEPLEYAFSGEKFTSSVTLQSAQRLNVERTRQWFVNQFGEEKAGAIIQELSDTTWTPFLRVKRKE